jgi:hypothetical protein
MKLTTAWANVVSQNLTLRATVLILALCTLVFSITTVRLAIRDPLIIDRECVSKAVTSAGAKHSTTEIDAFVRMALTKRFDTGATDTEIFLSDEENGFRAKEQDELSKRNITQRLVINGLKIDGSTVTVDADRLLSVGKVKSAIAFPLVVTLATLDRSTADPYGLSIRRVAQAKQEVSK